MTAKTQEKKSFANQLLILFLSLSGFPFNSIEKRKEENENQIKCYMVGTCL